jgi:drug/metabolite transporter (DMT)-like permease
MRIAAPEFGPVVLVELRVMIAALVLLPVLLVRENLISLSRNWGKLVLLGVVNSAIPFYLFAYSTLTLTAGYASILNATAPMFAAAIAWLWLSQRLTALQSAGLFIGIVGVTVLVWPKLSFGIDGAAIAIAAGLLASFCYGVAANYTKKHMGGLSSLSIATGSMLAASLVLLPGAVFYWPQQAISTDAWISAVTLGIASTGFAYILYFRLIRHVGPAKAITVTYLLPVFAVFWGAIVLSEKITFAMIVGAVIIFTGTALATGIVSERTVKGP